MSDPSSPSYRSRGTRSFIDQLTGAGPNSSRSQLSIRSAQRQVNQRIMWGELNADGTRK